MERRFDTVDAEAVTTIRALAMDAVQAANSGHPGTPMALAPVAWVLFTRMLKHNPGNPAWPDRDRFVLSCGHASMLLYATLHLTGYDLSLDELRRFRQWGSRTAGHPEHGLAPGVETTTGPLGQGCGNAVGMALAEAHLAARFNSGPQRVVDHWTWVLCSDGDLMEGVSAEAASMAGHLRLGKLVWIWDDNRITIEGGTDLTFSEQVLQRFDAYGWHTVAVEDANDLDAVLAALQEARQCTDRPSLVRVRSEIAWGAPTKRGTADAHGAPLGEDEVAATKRAYGWPEDSDFLVPDRVRARGLEVRHRGGELEAGWQAAVASWAAENADAAREWERRQAGTLPAGWLEHVPSFTPDDGPLATRAASGKVLNAVASVLPELVGGSADLAPSNKTLIAASGDFTAAAPGERNLRFGVREHGMGATLNGMALHGGVRPYGGTFLIFSDYMRPSIRLAALMGQPVVYVFTHDSVWVGEDGPTHQPVEQLLALRAIPDLVVIRPADANETAAAWKVAMERRSGPVALALTRQKLPVLAATASRAGQGVPRGAYVLLEPDSDPALVLLASGSEVHLALQAADRLAEDGVPARVVSMPSWELFDLQPRAYRDAILLPGVPRLAVEAGVSRGWRDYVGDTGAVVGIDRFGASAPGGVVAAKLGLTAEAVVERARQLADGADMG